MDKADTSQAMNDHKGSIIFAKDSILQTANYFPFRIFLKVLNVLLENVYIAPVGQPNDAGIIAILKGLLRLLNSIFVS